MPAKKALVNYAKCHPERCGNSHLQYLGVDVPPQKFCEALEKNEYDVLGLSVLLTTSMPSAINTINELKTAGFKDKVKVMIGGAPVTHMLTVRPA